MKKVLVIQPLRQEALDLFEARSADIRYEVITDYSPENLHKHIAGVDAITVRTAPLSPEILDAAPNLQVVSRHGVGYDNIPVDYCTERGIPVTVVGSVNSISVAEQTIFLMLAAAKAGIVLDQAIRRDDYEARSRVLSTQLLGRTLFIIGFGRIGQLVAARARAFDLKILVFDPYVDPKQFPEVTFVKTIAEGLPQADVLSLHTPLTPETRNLIGAKELEMMPKGAIVLNLARGGLIDEAALLAQVQAGHIYGAGLDVFVKEPLPADDPLTTDERIVLSPHSAALTEDSLIAMGLATARNAIAALDGTLDPTLVVNPAVLKP